MSGTSRWDALVDRMLAELRGGDPRSESYWAQQLAFGPVLVHAVKLRCRENRLSAADARVLAPCARLAAAAFAALPELDAGDPIALRLLAARQARAIGWGRRGTLARLLERLGDPSGEQVRVVPSRMARPYPLLGFRPDERLAG